MAENLGLYSPGNVTIVVNNRTIRGVADGEFIRTERNTPEEFRTKAGAQGDFVYEENLDKTGSIIIVLNQNSPDNTFLQSLLDGKSVFQTAIVSRQNYKEEAKASTCMIGQRPRPTMGQETTNKEWTIICGRLIETDKPIN